MSTLWIPLKNPAELLVWTTVYSSGISGGVV